LHREIDNIYYMCNKWLSGWNHLYIVNSSHEPTSGHVMMSFSRTQWKTVKSTPPTPVASCLLHLDSPVYYWSRRNDVHRNNGKLFCQPHLRRLRVVFYSWTLQFTTDHVRPFSIVSLSTTSCEEVCCVGRFHNLEMFFYPWSKRGPAIRGWNLARIQGDFSEKKTCWEISFESPSGSEKLWVVFWQRLDY